MKSQKARSETTVGEHDWIRPNFVHYDCCRKCGIVRRADGKNRPCRGIVHIDLRADGECANAN